MIRIDLGTEGLGRIRFAFSPLDPAKDLLFALAQMPQALSGAWRARAAKALSEQHLGLLAVVAGGGPHGYAPDFLRPQPAAGPVTDLDGALHAVATTPSERIRYELEGAVNGHSWDQAAASRAPRILLAALERGEAHLAHRVAGELAQFWHAALAPEWPRIRARLEGDINVRATSIARNGIADTIDQLAPNLEWRHGSLQVHLRPSSRHRLHLSADAAILVPSVFADRAIFCAGEPTSVAAPRKPMILYPAGREDRLPSSDEQLLGSTRARMLAELAQPRSTSELAQRLYLSPSTVSYHLQILHRAGRVQRTRSSRVVLYQRTPQ
ncbi:winged helix-turn-helix domain-containing protein [Kitasatospora terrestris]|uniref:DUF5937 family protein n=1 Tax=Kitasatospora terrestris TaxID=258051 RepID=A0ABP9DA03_9ACTN